MMIYSRILQDQIEREKQGLDFCCKGQDRVLLKSMFEEINQYASTEFCYLAEICTFTIPGCGNIISKYIRKFTSQSIRGYLLYHLVSDRIENCDKLILDLYNEFKKSDKYITIQGEVESAHIYTRFDNAFKELKQKRIKNDLLELARNPRDFFYLPFTMRMLASWKVPEMEELLIRYSLKSNISEMDVGLNQNMCDIVPSLSFIKRQIRFTAIEGLKYYPSQMGIQILREYVLENDKDIQKAALKTLKRMEKYIT